MTATYQVSDNARFTYDAKAVFGGFISRDPMRYVADAFRHCERANYTVSEFIFSAIPEGQSLAPYWRAVWAAYEFVCNHPNARQVVHAFRKNAPRTIHESASFKAGIAGRINEACDHTRAAGYTAPYTVERTSREGHRVKARRMIHEARRMRTSGAWPIFTDY